MDWGMTDSSDDREQQRLEALRRYGILDTPAEPEFDEVTRTIAQICNTPTALVSLIDDQRQWFKSRHGFDLQQTERRHAFCDHAIKSNELFEVPDATKDPRFANNPLVTGGPNIRFYAGAPLVTPDGHALGTLCVTDTRPRQLDGPQRSCLQALSKQVMAQLELRRALAEKDRALQQKDLLLKDVSHRVKNGLQLIGSLVQMQRRKITDPVAQRQIADMAARVQALASVHRHLYRSEQVGSAELAAYLREVAKPLAQSADVEIQVDAPQVLMPVDALVPLAMVLSELVTNSAKYARWPEGSGKPRRPTVKITARMSDQAGTATAANGVTADGLAPRLHLTVEDDGPGLPAGFDLEHSSGLGMRIVGSLVQQLGGTITAHNGSGAQFDIDVTMTQNALAA
jgi:two-component sensor histidine kinase